MIQGLSETPLYFCFLQSNVQSDVLSKLSKIKKIFQGIFYLQLYFVIYMKIQNRHCDPYVPLICEIDSNCVFVAFGVQNGQLLNLLDFTKLMRLTEVIFQ